MRVMPAMTKEPAMTATTATTKATSMYANKKYYVYIMTNKNNTVLYIGVTNDLERRVEEHKEGRNKKCFTYRYNCNKCIYFEEYDLINDAIAREKQLKNWKRVWKEELINSINPEWDPIV